MHHQNEADTALREFYARFAPLYHLIYPDWEKSIERQASMLDRIIRENWGDGIRAVLDVSCGIGTQALGLAGLGYQVTGSDLSPEVIERAEREALKRGLSIPFSAADMRKAASHHARQFDLVISCDNAVPHLLSDADILAAFKQLQACTRPGGGCLISVRDYDKEDLAGQKVAPYGTGEENGVRYLILQVWDFHGAIYDLAIYFVEDRGGSECVAHVIRCQDHAVGIARLIELLTEAGFVNVRRIEGRFFQPVIVGSRAKDG